MPSKTFLHTQLSQAPQKYFQSGPALAKAGPVHVCILTIKLCHEFAFNLSRKSREINYLTISGYYPVYRLAIIDIRTKPIVADDGSYTTVKELKGLDIVRRE